MKYCARCVYPANHPLNLTFDEQGVCSGCRIHEEKDELDWRERGERLRRIFDAYRNRSDTGFDCIVPVSGARDSYFIVHTVKHVYGMTPLLVSYNRHYNTRRGIRNLSYLRTLFDCDMVDLTVGVSTVQKIVRHTVERLGSLHWHVLAGQTVYPVQTAVKLKIPLIVWGAHQGCDQVGMYSHLDEVEMTRKYRKDHDLMGVEAEDLVGGGGLSERDLIQYFYPHDKEIEKVGVRGIYLNNYVRWDSKAQHEKMIGLFGYEAAEQQRTFDTYNDVDCIHYSGLHDWIKFLKWGYGKVSDHAAREIRLKRMTREEGIAMVRRYQDVKPADVPQFLAWSGLSEGQLFGSVDRFRDPAIWERAGGEWRLKDSVVHHESDPGVDAVRLERKSSCHFMVTPSRRPGVREDEYVLMERGWVDSRSY